MAFRDISDQTTFEARYPLVGNTIAVAILFKDKPRFQNELAELENLQVDLKYTTSVENIPIFYLTKCPDPWSYSYAIVFHKRFCRPECIVRRVGKHFIKLFTDKHNGLREAVIHRYIYCKLPQHVVPFVMYGSSALVNTPGMTFDPREFPTVLVTSAPKEEHKSCKQIKNLDTAINATQNLSVLLDLLHRDYSLAHFDIHSGNVLFTETGRAVLLDFGLTEIYDDEVVEDMFRRFKVDVSRNHFDDDEDLHLNLLRQKYPKASKRQWFSRVYDRVRAVTACFPRFSRALSEKFLPGLRDLNTWQDLDSKRFRVHFRVAFRAFDLLVHHPTLLLVESA